MRLVSVLGARQHRAEGVNWLLIGLIAASLAVHAGIFWKAPGLFDSKEQAYLEIHIQKNAKPAPRKIPRPQSSPAAPPVPSVPVMEESAVMPEMTVPARAPEPSSLAAPAPVPAPDMAFAPDAPPDIIEWTPPVKGDDAGSDSADQYLAALRQRIEEKKSYPAAARHRRIEGQAVVEFSIGAEGTASGMRIVTSSRSELLDQAALEAVTKASPFEQPPAGRFELPLKLQVPITFEIIP